MARSKYHAKKVELDGMVFDSMKEAARWRELVLEQRAGAIKDLRRQVKYELIPAHKGVVRSERACAYIADFTYYRGGEFIVEDVKGVRTEVYKIKRKLMAAKYGIEIREV